MHYSLCFIYFLIYINVQNEIQKNIEVFCETKQNYLCYCSVVIMGLKKKESKIQNGIINLLVRSFEYFLFYFILLFFFYSVHE